MNYVVRTKTNFPKPQAWTVNRPSQLAVQPKKLDIITRRYDISWLAADGATDSKTSVAPALPIFEQAFNAVAQGALIQTETGHVAIEDLHPGMMIATADAGLQRLTWIGSMTLFPSQHELGLPVCQLFRMTDGGYGHDRGAPDLMVGSGARILPGMLAVNSSSPLVQPGALADGHSVIAINPVSAVRLFHLGLENHGLIRANGVVLESYHPGEQPHMQMAPELYNHFVALFPHIKEIEDFGPLNHRRTD